jgi:glucose-1-phosphate thymidylyltransferase
MKCLLLAAGFGTRLKKLNINMSKGLIPYCGVPLISHIVHRVPDNIEIYAHTNLLFEKDYRDWQKGMVRKVKISVEPTMDSSQALGAVGSINYFVHHNKIDDDLMVLATDNYFEFNLADFLGQFDGEHPLVALHDIRDKERAKNFGVVAVSAGRITSFVEKPANPESSLISTGCYIFPRRAVTELKEYCSRGTKDNLGDFIRFLLSVIPVHAYVFAGAWFDIGNEADYKEIIKGKGN